MSQTIGIIGGGQLGRMLAIAASRLNFHTVILEPLDDCPAAQLTNHQIVKAYDDPTGLAELALREGKIAHVVRNFAVAAELAGSRSVRERTRDEVEYFTRLSEDEEYMDLELSRINLLDTLQSTSSTATWITLCGFPVIGLGLLFGNPSVANTGWAVSGLALLVWLTAGVFSRMFVLRIPYEHLEED